MTTTTITRPAANGNDRMRTADLHILAMPTATPEEEALERELAIRAVRRILGTDVGDMLDVLGLAPKPNSAPAVRATGKRCTTCGETRPRAEFYRRPRARDGLYSQCKPCHNAYKKKPAPKRPTPKRRLRIIACAACQELRGHYARGWCRACWLRWNRAGQPDDGPPPVTHKARRKQYWKLTREQGFTPKEAAALVGMSDRNARRYEIHFAKHGAPWTEQEAA